MLRRMTVKQPTVQAHSSQIRVELLVDELEEADGGSRSEPIAELRLHGRSFLVDGSVVEMSLKGLMISSLYSSHMEYEVLVDASESSSTKYRWIDLEGLTARTKFYFCQIVDAKSLH